MRNVTMVVLVLMTSCHDAENENIGPERNHSTTNRSAMQKLHGVPTAFPNFCANLRNIFVRRFCRNE